MPLLASLGGIGVGSHGRRPGPCVWAVLVALCAAPALANDAATQAPADLADVQGVAAQADRASPVDEASRGLDLVARQEAQGQPAAAPPVRITIGAYHQAGEPAYPVRDLASGGALIVSFSSTPPRQTVAGAAMLPSRLPLSAARLTSRFGSRTHPIDGVSRRHVGIDLAATWGSPLQATQDGVVTGAGWNGGYGLLVTIAHQGGVETRYAHLSGLNVAVGQQVSAGDIVGHLGSTGDSTGPHVHYEVRVNGVAVDPLAR